MPPFGKSNQLRLFVDPDLLPTYNEVNDGSLVLTSLQIKCDQGLSFHGIRMEFVEEVEHEQRSCAQNPLHR